jgi:hypothetical protein
MERGRMMPNKSEMLAMKILENARDRARLVKAGERHIPVMVLRVSRFVETLKMAPHLIRYELDYLGGAPGWPRFAPFYEDCRIEISEAAL